jgi:hypothetical protein
MSSWVVDAGRRPGVLWVEVIGAPSPEDMAELVVAHNAAVDSFGGAAYSVFCNLQEMKVLSPESAAVFEQAKAYSGEHDNFRGSAILVASAVVGMQHRRTSITGGVIETEMISGDEEALWEHLSALPV